MNASTSIYYLATAKHDYAFARYFDSFGKDIAQHFSLIHIEALLEMTEFPSGVYIFADLERLSVAQLRILSHIYDTMKASKSAYYLLNDPGRVKCRFELLRALSTAGLNSFKAYRLNEIPEQPTRPLFLRIRREHTGALTEPTTDRKLLDEEIATILMHGVNPDDLIAVEYCDTRGSDRLFHKYSAYRIDGKIIPANLHIGEAWQLQYPVSLIDQEIVAKEMAYVRQNPHAVELTELFDFAHIDYGRIDYSILDGVIQTWEINTNPVIAQAPEKIHPDRLPAYAMTLDWIKEAFEELASRPLTGCTVRIENLGAPVQRFCKDLQ